MAKEIFCCIGVDVDAVAGWLGSYGGEDSPDDISRGLFAGEVGVPRLLKLFDKYGLNYHEASLPAQVYSAWHRVVRLSFPNGWLETTTPKNLPAQLVALYKITTADKRKRRVMLKLLEREAKKLEAPQRARHERVA